MRLHEAVALALANKATFRKNVSGQGGRWLEVKETCGLRYFNFIDRVQGQTKEQVIFTPEDFDLDCWEVQEKPRTALDRALESLGVLQKALMELKAPQVEAR